MAQQVKLPPGTDIYILATLLPCQYLHPRSGESWLKYLNSYHPCGRPGWDHRLLALVWPQP